MVQPFHPGAVSASHLTAEEVDHAPAPSSDLLEEVLAAGVSSGRSRGLLDRLRGETSLAQALALWLGPDLALLGEGSALKERIARRLGRDIARIDLVIERQVNAILHHPDFQKLESAWRGLRYLIDQLPAQGGVEIKVLNLSRAELQRDLSLALEFDQSYLFRKVYSEEFDMPGGKPYGVLLGDYEFKNHPEDIELLGRISGVAAAAFAPFIAAAHPSLLDLRSFAELERPFDLARAFDSVRYLQWNSLRKTEDARFVGLTLPRFLLRLPYGDDKLRRDGFYFREDVGAPDRAGYLWGNAAFTYGAVLMRNFAQSGWLADIRGARTRPIPGQQGGPEEPTGGLVTGLPNYWFATDRPGLIPRCPTEVVITDALDKDLGDIGFLPLSWCQDTNRCAFHGSQSIQSPQVYDRLEASVNARLSSMLQYMFCASRFAHYIRVIARDKIGSMSDPVDLEEHLRRWLLEYTNANDQAPPDLKARYPLRDSHVEVREVPGKPGRYTCVIDLRPQFQLDQLAGTIHLETRSFSAV